MSDAPDHVLRNREQWNRWAEEYAASGEQAWAREEPTWGIWNVPERDLGVLPAELAGRDVVELGCGTAYISAWLARRGARVAGIDNSPAQLATARRLQRRHGLSFPLLHGNAETLPFPDASFDLALSEYGACTWADPERWVPEAARVLRPGGELIFLANSLLLTLCFPEDGTLPVSAELVRPSFGLGRLEWPDETGVEFARSHGDWIRLLRRSGFEVEDLLEVQPGEDAVTRYPYVSLEWARRWPCEEVWKLRRTGPRGGAGVRLREIREEDIDAFFEHQRDPATHHQAAFTSWDPEDADGFRARWLRILSDPTCTGRTIELPDGRVAGSIVRFMMEGLPEVTYWIGREFGGRGIATAALRAFLREFPERPLHACVAVDNPASLRVLEKCGFRRAGTSREYAPARGTEVDQILLRIT